MQGIGSDPNYNPNGSSDYGDFNVDSIAAGLGSMWGSVKNTASAVVREDNINALKNTTSSFWGSLTAGASSLANTIAAPQDDDGLANLQRQVAAQKPQQSKYAGFGSSNAPGGSAMNTLNQSAYTNPSTASQPSSGCLQEAQGLPHEDRNGIQRLTGESDEQYVLRQTRLRDEARARMSAKFGSGGLSSTSPARTTSQGSAASLSSGISAYSSAQNSAPSSGNHKPSPSSGNSSGPPLVQKMPAPKKMNSDDFFSSFGT